MQAFILLADAAQHDAVSGKINILGGDWSVTTQRQTQTALVVFYRVGWDEVAQQKSFTLRLLDDEGKLVRVGDSQHTVEYVGRLALADDDELPDEYVRMIDIHNSIAITIPPLPLIAGQRYTWSLEIDGEPLASVAFVVRPDDETVLETDM
ncbi:DUF6941 family protein [Nonomuraea wenchangensis]